MKDVGAGRRRRVSRRLIGHWPHTGRAQQQDSSWKPLGAAEGTKGGCRRAWTACGRSWRGRDRARCRAPCNVSFVTSKRNNSTTRCVQNTLDPVFDVEPDGELGSDSKLRRNGVFVTVNVAYRREGRTVVSFGPPANVSFVPWFRARYKLRVSLGVRGGGMRSIHMSVVPSSVMKRLLCMHAVRPSAGAVCVTVNILSLILSVTLVFLEKRKSCDANGPDSCSTSKIFVP